jgi:predicted lipid-binding transport protein (Tim44 family)
MANRRSNFTPQQARSQAPAQRTDDAKPPVFSRPLAGALAGAVLVAALAAAWIDGGEQALRPIAQPVDLPVDLPEPPQ